MDEAVEDDSPRTAANTLAASPPPALGGPPQWGIDLTFKTSWELYRLDVRDYNTAIDILFQCVAPPSLLRPVS